MPQRTCTIEYPFLTHFINYLVPPTLRMIHIDDLKRLSLLDLLKLLSPQLLRAELGPLVPPKVKAFINFGYGLNSFLSVVCDHNQ